MLILACCCGGCWEEVHFESQEGSEVVKVTPAEGLPVPVKRVEVDIEVDDVEEDVEVESVEEAIDVISLSTEANSSGDGDGEELRVEVLTRFEAWQMASRWSMAAALQAKDSGYGARLELAAQGARELGVVLPELPIFEEGAKRLPVSLSFLLEEAGPLLVEKLQEKQGTEQAALAELAMKSNVLLLVYTPKSTRVQPLITAIRMAAETSGLPEPVWRELIDLLEARAEFNQVKAAVYQLHQQVAAILSVESGS